MPLTKHNDTAFHEAGHCLISYLAKDLLEIKFVTVNAELSKSQDKTSLGGLRGSLKKEVGTLTFKELDLMVLIFLAGMAADDINHCDCQLTEQLYDNSVFANKMSSNKYSGDSALLMPYLKKIIPELNIEQRPYTIRSQRLLYELFIDSNITPILIDLRNEIENSPHKTLTGKEIVEFLDKTELKKWRDNQWKEIIDSRISNIKKTAPK